MSHSGHHLLDLNGSNSKLSKTNSITLPSPTVMISTDTRQPSPRMIGFSLSSCKKNKCTFMTQSHTVIHYSVTWLKLRIFSSTKRYCNSNHIAFKDKTDQKQRMSCYFLDYKIKDRNITNLLLLSFQLN